MTELTKELKVKIVEALGLTDIEPEDISDDEQLVGGDLGIDSIDVLELVMLIDKEYGIKIENKEDGELVFRSVKDLAEFIDSKR